MINFENKDRSQTEFENGGRNSILVEVTHHEVTKISPNIYLIKLFAICKCIIYTVRITVGF